MCDAHSPHITSDFHSPTKHLHSHLSPPPLFTPLLFSLSFTPTLQCPMSTSFPRHNSSLRSTSNAVGRHRQPLFPAARVWCSAATPAKSKHKAGQIVIEPTQLSQPTFAKSPGGALTDDPDLLSTWPHRAWVAGGCATVLISLVKCATGCAHSHMLLEPVMAGLIGYVLADLGSGIYHWGIDNYGDASTPVFGSQIEAFQGHHKWPWTITRRQFANNLHALARAVTFTVLPLELALDDPVLHGFVGVCSGCIMFSQQFHAWAHGTKSRLPPLVVALQDAGLLVSRSQHAAHHRTPYNNNYCIVSGVWNQFLDKNKVFEGLEMILFFKLGVRPRSWSEPSSGWTELVETPPQTTVQ